MWQIEKTYWPVTAAMFKKTISCFLLAEKRAMSPMSCTPGENWARGLDQGRCIFMSSDAIPLRVRAQLRAK